MFSHPVSLWRLSLNSFASLRIVFGFSVKRCNVNFLTSTAWWLYENNWRKELKLQGLCNNRCFMKSCLSMGSYKLNSSSRNVPHKVLDLRNSLFFLSAKDTQLMHLYLLWLFSTEEKPKHIHSVGIYMYGCILKCKWITRVYHALHRIYNERLQWSSIIETQFWIRYVWISKITFTVVLKLN